MALKNCKECGSQISDKATSCPQCGSPQPKKTSVLTWICVGILALSFVISIFASNKGSDSDAVSGNNQEKVVSKWGMDNKKDEMTDNENVYVWLYSNNVLMKGNDLLTLEEPMISFRCENNQTEAVINFKRPLSAEYGNTLKRTVDFRLDDGKAYSVQLNASNDRSSYFIPSSIEQIKKMMQAKKLLISYTPIGNGKEILEFDISEIESKIKPIREKCNW